MLSSTDLSQTLHVRLTANDDSCKLGQKNLNKKPDLKISNKLYLIHSYSNEHQVKYIQIVIDATIM